MAGSSSQWALCLPLWALGWSSVQQGLGSLLAVESIERGPGAGPSVQKNWAGICPWCLVFTSDSVCGAHMRPQKELPRIWASCQHWHGKLLPV